MPALVQAEFFPHSMHKRANHIASVVAVIVITTRELNSRP